MVNAELDCNRRLSVFNFSFSPCVVELEVFELMLLCYFVVFLLFICMFVNLFVLNRDTRQAKNKFVRFEFGSRIIQI